MTEQIELNLDAIEDAENAMEDVPFLADSEDIGTCSDCGNPTYRPDGKSPTGRKLRVPKKCDACKTTKTTTSGVVRRTRKPDIQDGVTELYTSLGMLAMMKDQQLGMLIIGQRRLEELAASMEGQSAPNGIADDAGKAWANVAANNPAVAKALEKMLETGIWAELINAHVPLLGLVIARKPKLGRLKTWALRRRVKRASGGETNAE